ncbi:glutathione S-transferase family protein [Rhodoblastus acidophilus]|uniref:Glutathione S-transferase family protein n=1 Tax=Candidatus Rhodoblastus alkanivorans TaxID=2954117 RepID=A0ABS9Z6Y4_9HYPH|nr:glutathione S-transferase family protein [Candidatus Rhodoblastus alkanivorans]MCI4680725.1 glutathione S-transferase family protein [Candidatus Rhodoblastus alkanivorans]MCI4683366.1 glutathione S-transferase family protein [Candidatus Rhodoblastus alkanivorans]MDI4640678.1 glutathione S-transferase family protein [Rhodoblastus acidophilus]
MRLYWAPNTRSLRVLWLLEEIGAPYERVLVDLKNGGQRTPAFHAVNPMEKVPALQDGEACVAESGAIIAYLAEKFPDAGLAPAIGDARRGRYLQWLFFSGACVEGALTQKFGNVEMPEGSAGWGSFDKVFNVLDEVLSANPYLLGEKFSAADVLIASDLHFTINIFKMLEPRPVFASYLERCQSRPAFARAAQINSDGI